jgi:hypothetical protein
VREVAGSNPVVPTILYFVGFSVVCNFHKHLEYNSFKVSTGRGHNRSGRCQQQFKERKRDEPLSRNQ